MKTLRQTILATANYYGRTIDEGLLEMYHEDLSDLDPQACMNAYAQYRRNPQNKTFPLPAQIREIVNPEQYVSVEAKAREIAARITGAISKFGWCNGNEARLFIGPEGWDVVQRQGGWAYICEHHGRSINPTAFQAQVRDQVEGSLKYGVKQIESAIAACNEAEARIGVLEHANDFIKLVAREGEEPDGAA